MSGYVPKAVKDVYKLGKNTVLQVPEIERKVKEATSNEKWGPSGTQMRDIAQATHSYNDLPAIMATIWRRLNDHGKYWRHVYKSLLLIDYLLKNGSEQVVRECRSNVIQIQTLTEFQHIDENDKDVGLSVRERAKLIVELLHDDKRLRAEREKARSNAKKYLVGMGSDVGGYGGDSYSGGGGPDYRDHDDDWNKKSDHDSYRDEPDNTYHDDEKPSTTTSRGSSNGSNGSGGARPRVPSFDKGTPSSSSSSSSSSTTSRPRAPSFESNKNPVAAPAPAVQTNLFDLDDVPPTQSSKPASSFDFFNTPSPATFPPTNNAFGTSPATSQGGSGFGAFSSASTTGGSGDFFFDPRGNTAAPPATNTTSTPFTSGGGVSSSNSDTWADFQGSSGNQQQPQQQQEAKKEDLWSQASNLIGNLDLSGKSTSNTSTTANKAPMGALGSSKPMGKPTGPGVAMGSMTSTPATTTVTPTGPGVGYGMPTGYGNPGGYGTPAPVGGVGYGTPTAVPGGYGYGVNPNTAVRPPMTGFGMPTTTTATPGVAPYGTTPAYGTPGYGNPTNPNLAALGRGTQPPTTSNQPNWGF